MGTKISELASAESLTGDELIPIVQTGSTKKTTINDMNYFNGIYSTTEQRIGTWINGKPLYRLVMEVDNPTVTTDGTIARKRYSISDYNMDYSFVMLAYNNGSVERAGLPYITGAGYRMGCSVSTTEFILYSNATGFNNQKTIAIICYTKTTDTATRGGEQLRSTNTGSLVGMGDRAEVTLEKEEQPEEITETKSAEVDKLESEEGSGDSR